MKFHSTLPLALALGMTLGAGLAQAQTKKELAAKIVQLQQPAFENLARGLAEQPAVSMLNQAGMALQARVPADKREAVGKDLQADAKKYVDDVSPMLRDRAVKLGPTTIQPLLEEKFTEDELKQVIVMLESPAIRKYQQSAGDMEVALRDKIVTETRATVEPKLAALEQSMGKRLAAAQGDAAPAAAPAAATKPAAKPAPAPKK